MLVGHITFLCLVRRELLCIFSTVYRFIQDSYLDSQKLWASVVQELTVFKGLMVFLESPWDREWNSLVLASDASLTGYGVSKAWWPTAVCRDVGRIRERDRFRDANGVGARASALSAAGLDDFPTESDWRNIQGRSAGEVECCSMFPEVPAE